MFEYLAIDRRNLELIAAGRVANFRGLTCESDALPPARVAVRAINALKQGVSPNWCVPYLIIKRESQLIVGSCTFKGFPVEGFVEVGYAIAETQRRQGAGSAALAFLLEQAASAASVTEVVAYIDPENTASQGLVSSLGFKSLGILIDPDGEKSMKWIYQVAI